MADDQNTKTMDINDLVRELSKSSTSPAAPTPTPVPQTQAPRPSFSAPKPPMSPPMAGSPSVPSTPKPFVPTPAPSPVTPPLPKPPEMPRPQFNVLPPPLSQSKPVPSFTAPPSTPGVKEYQSSIRTMNEDISKIKQGQKPMGIDVPRKVEQAVPTPQPMAPKPAMPSQQFKVPSVNLGEAQKTGPLAQSKDVLKPPITPKAEPKPQIYIPEGGQKGGNRSMLFVGIGILALVAGFAYWFFVLRSPAPEVVIETPTPTPTQVPTPIPLPLEKLGIAEKVSIPSTSVFLSSSTTEMNAKQPTVVGQIKLLDIVDENQQKYSFKEFLTKLLIDTSTLNDSELLDTREWVLGLYGQLGSAQSVSVRPFFVLVQKDGTLTTNLMNTWESRIINDLTKFFNLGKVSSKLSFTPDVYSGINFRFVRIPDKDLGVAYAIFQNYLVLGSSRDSFRAVIDALATP